MRSYPKVMLLIETSRACGRGILLGIARYSRFYGPWQLTQKPPFYLNNENDNKQITPEGWIADGMIVSQAEIPEEIIKIGIPVIGIDIKEPISGLPNIMGNADAIAEQAVEHFITRGFRHLAYCGYENITWSQERGKAFAKKVTAAGLQCYTYYQQTLPGSNLSWYERQILLSDWLKSISTPSGLFACNDDCSRQVNQACQTAGLKVPQDIAILGVDNDEIVCLPSDPPLSSIALNFEQAGFEAAQLLDRLMTGKEKPQNQKILLSPTHIVTRQSSDVLAIEDADVSQAVRFMYQNANQIIQVNDIVKEVAVSRRSLENKFRKIMGRSVNSEIRRIRVQRIAQMLIETNQSIERIALNLGYTDATHIGRYFRKEKGMSPQAYRKMFGQK